MNVENIKDNPIKTYVSKISRRAERFQEDKILYDVFVNYGVLETLNCNENEFIVGRRGTGKTHLLRTFCEKSLIESGNDVRTLYIDCRNLMSGGELKNKDDFTQAKLIVNRLVREIKGYLLEEASRLEMPQKDKENEITKDLINIEKAIARYVDNKEDGLSIELRQALEKLITTLGSNVLIVILDEWVDIDIEVQPYAAEIIKRLFFGSNKICFKFGVVEFRQKMNKKIDGRIIGFERSADVFRSIDLDKYLVYDTDKDYVANILGEILFNHIFINSDDKENLLALKKEEKIQAVLNCFFVSKDSFRELVRAGEGVVRDFLLIFYNAYFNYFLPDEKAKKITIKHIRKGARDHFINEKIDFIKNDKRLLSILEDIIKYVIRDKGVRSFMIRQELSEHELLSGLFDARLLHLIHRGWSHKDTPGVRYDIFTIDYGTYVELINTAKEPQMDLFETVDKDEDLVPFDDKRKIRRIVLDEKILQKNLDSAGLDEPVA